MGQASEKNLESLLKLGAPEAVMAVAYAAGLTDELARRVWWASQNLATMEIARVMLMHPAVRAGAMGQVLADYLIEHLPFEEDPIAAMQSVRAVLAAGLLAPELRDQLRIELDLADADRAGATVSPSSREEPAMIRTWGTMVTPATHRSTL